MNCKHCNGTGVMHDRDDMDHLLTFTCSQCDGAGELPDKMNNFERWKQELTIEEASKLINDTRFYCGRCPAWKQCTQKQTLCADTFKEWGKRHE